MDNQSANRCAWSTERTGSARPGRAHASMASVIPSTAARDNTEDRIVGRDSARIVERLPRSYDDRIASSDPVGINPKLSQYASYRCSQGAPQEVRRLP
jgi:hypothetical protein